MLYPQLTSTRQMIALDGFWNFAPDYDNDGESKAWHTKLEADREISVLASWNEQYQDLMHFFGVGWYERELIIPRQLLGERIMLRVGAANYLSTVWVNGVWVGEHESGHLPFEFDISSHVVWEDTNRITIRVDATIAADRLPAGHVESEMIIGFKGQFPSNYFDFFPYGGINRPITIYSTPTSYIEGIKVNTSLNGNTGKVGFKLTISTDNVLQCKVIIPGTDVVSTYEVQGQAGQLVEVKDELSITDARLWGPNDPYLYELKVSLWNQEGQQIDQYTQSFGVRTVQVTDTQLLLNGEPVFLTGFGMHEDFPVLGKGMNHAVITKDFNLLDWMGANSIRTSHYPYSDEFLQYADRKGLLVIGETPFVGFVPSHYRSPEVTAKAHRIITEMIQRDYNHPSIIAWSLANEGDTFVPEADSFYKGLYDHARTLDVSRPMTIVNCLDVEEDVALKHFDFISINRYYGWYEQSARLDLGCEVLDQKLDRCYEVFGKPIIVTEFGADAVAGVHTDPPELFSEEYQAEMVTRQYTIIRNKPYTIGAHVWSFADFKTSQTPSRVVVNRKGIFTRERQPKLAAHKLRELWLKQRNQ